ncbi:DUF4153 domain-containing protein [Micromonospora sp. DSM 115977]|uniref:DUF4153 domain-containing protein n=1 Tax=Micromonospora reichwaldensis TaxID=3075516 RepID=A0ABU2WV31_9ACTN|nr:DUF4153 domain-containing protein [Micromonospora sp. DSM 115977]MDT0529785.1 DUF4153 domain-containing protein [Micromonospora sp. DSM 115977]
MTQPPPVSGPPGSGEPTGSTDGDDPGDATPHLLVIPSLEGAPPPMVWPGAEGAPAWAIPVSIPPGTRGYAVFIPLMPATAAAAPVAAGPPAPTPVVPAPRPAEATAAPAPTAVVGPQESFPARTAAVTAADAAAPAAEAAPTTGTPATAAPATAGAPAAPSAGTGASPARPPATTVQQPAATPLPAPYRIGVPAGAPAPYRGYQPVPRPPSFLDTRWPGPAPAQDRAVPLAVLAGALGLAFFVPLTRTGIGWFLGWLALTVAVVLAVRRAGAELPRADRLIRAGWATASLALLSVLAFRNAWWLVTFCVLGALACAALAIVGGRLIRSILFSLVAAPFAAFRGQPWVRGHLRAPANPHLARRVVGSTAATVAVLIVFGALLSSADGAFSVMLGELIPEVNGGAAFRWILLAAVGGLCAVAAVYTLAAPPDLSTVDRPGTRRFGLVEWAPVISALTLLFGGFVAVQFTVLFGGQRHVLRTAGLSYAEYARSGFWQLVVVTMLTLAVLGGVARWARRDRAVERHLLRVLLGLLSVLSFVIVGSALSRMYTYQKAYSFTGERLFVMAFELLLGTVFLMILVAGLRWRGAWIPGTTVALAVVMLLGLAVLNPEDYAARRNIARYEQTGKIDAWYLRALSADATPALAGLPDPVRRCTLSWVAKDLDESDPWYAWNLGRIRARAALDRAGPGAVGGPRDCRAADQFDLPKRRR